MISQLIRAASLSTALLATSCAPPTIGAERAPAYFAEHQSQFERVLEQVRLCQPASGRIDYETDFQCASSAGTPQAVRDAMRSARAQWIRTYYDEREGVQPQMSSLYIAMPATRGFIFAGPVEAFVYEVTPAENTAHQYLNDGTAVIERMPITDAPYHWHWWTAGR